MPGPVGHRPRPGRRGGRCPGREWGAPSWDPHRAADGDGRTPADCRTPGTSVSTGRTRAARCRRGPAAKERAARTAGGRGVRRRRRTAGRRTGAPPLRRVSARRLRPPAGRRRRPRRAAGFARAAGRSFSVRGPPGDTAPSGPRPPGAAEGHCPARPAAGRGRRWMLPRPAHGHPGPPRDTAPAGPRPAEAPGGPFAVRSVARS